MYNSKRKIKPNVRYRRGRDANANKKTNQRSQEISQLTTANANAVLYIFGIYGPN